MEHSHLYKQYHLEYLNIPEAVNNFVVFRFILRCFTYANYLKMRGNTDDLVASKSQY